MLTYPTIDPVLLYVAGKPLVHWYGLMYVLGFMACYFLMRSRLHRYSNWDTNKLSDLLFYGALGVILGGRLGYILFYQFDHYWQYPLDVLKVWQGGLSFHGGFLGVMVAIAVFCKQHGEHPVKLLDMVAPATPIGLMLGRLGNFINGELYGRATSPDFALAMVFPTDPQGLARHPSQLYQALGEGLLLFVLLWWFSMRPRPRYAVAALFLMGYGAARFMVEFVRQPDADQGFVLLGWMTKGQLLTLPMIIAGAIMMWLAYRNRVYDWQVR